MFAQLCHCFLNFALHNFFVPYALYFTLTAILSCNFCIGKYGFGNLTVDFHCQKPSLMQTRRCVHKICVKKYTHFCALFLYIGLSLCTIFLYRMRYFCTLTAILFCIFTLLNTVAVVLPLIFTTVKCLLLQTRFGVH